MLAKLTFAALLSVMAVPAMAATCEATVESNDAMQFDTKEMTIDRSCTEFKLTLKHVGQLPKNAMGHNWVLTTDADKQAVAQDGMTAGLDNDYVKPDDERVIAHTKVIGGGEEDTITFDASKLEAGQDYTFFCSFPGHSAIMVGDVKVTG